MTISTNTTNTTGSSSASNPFAVLSSNTSSSASTAPTQTGAQQAQQTQSQFLKMLVAQMQNQDPMNPMDNAQVTSQLAQIQTVSGISTLNDSIQSLGTQIGTLQSLQSTSLLGHEVTVPGNRVDTSNSNGTGSGSYVLAGSADNVQLQVLNSAGAVVTTTQLGAQSVGAQNFTWTPPNGVTSANGPFTFKITATKGAAAVQATTYATDKIVAVNNSNGQLQLELQNLGTVPYSSVTQMN